MRAVLLSQVALLFFAVAAGVHAAPLCTYKGHDLSVIPPATLTIPISGDPYPYDADTTWRISLCAPQTFSWCTFASSGYIIQMSAKRSPVQCETAYDSYASSGWSSGGNGTAEALFQSSMDTSLLLEVDLVCDPSATTLKAVGNASANENVMTLTLGTNAICGAPAPPPTPSPQPSTPSVTLNACSGDNSQCAGSTCAPMVLETGRCKPSQYVYNVSQLISCNATSMSITTWWVPGCNGWPAKSTSYSRNECYDEPHGVGTFEMVGCSN